MASTILSANRQRKKALALLQEASWIHEGEVKVGRIRHTQCDDSKPVFGSLTIALQFGRVTVHNNGNYSYHQVDYEPSSATDSFQYNIRGKWYTLTIGIETSQ